MTIPWGDVASAYYSTGIFSIITVPANKAMQPIHDRMPFILPEGHEYVWLAKDFSLEMISPTAEKLIAKIA